MKTLYTLNEGKFEVIEYYDADGNEVRALRSNNAIYSLSLTGDKKYDFSNPYLMLYDIPARVIPNVNNALVLGAGCFTYPKYYISKYKDKYMDAVEIDKEIIDIAHKFFFLDDLYKEYDPEKKRLKIYAEDAYLYIENNKKKYDFIFADIFYDDEPVEEFLTNDFILKAKNRITDNGIFSSNYIITENNENKFYDYFNVLKQNFKYVHILTLVGYFKEGHGNVYIMCSNTNYELKNCNVKFQELEEDYILSFRKQVK